MSPLPFSPSRLRAFALLVGAALPLLPVRVYSSTAPRASTTKNPPEGPFYNLVYGQGGGKALRLDLYPATSAAAGFKPVPVIVFLHGGGWKIGDKHEIDPYVARFNEAGFAVVSVNYRLSRDGRFPTQIFDGKTAVRWTRANAGQYGLDPEHIGVMGFSAGGHLAALLGTTEGVKALEDRAEGSPEASSRVQAVCDVSGPVDLTLPPRSLIGKISIDGLLGGTAKEKPDLAREGNPALYATPDDAPTLLIYGGADELVPPIHAKILSAALRKAGVATETITVQGGKHVPFFEAQQQAALDFFARHLGAH